MHHFTYKDGILNAENVSLEAIAREVGTPFYCYSNATLERHYKIFADSLRDLDALVCYAIKANSNQAVIKTLAGLGAGMDVVSQGEIMRALAAGVAPDKIIFAGVGKTREEMAFALTRNILSFNVESESELRLLSEVAAQSGRTAKVALRINPDVDPKTHAKITTGKAENKFGVPFDKARELYGEAARLAGIDPVGVHMHIGSQIVELAPFAQAFQVMRELVQQLRADGHDIRHLDLGGGLGAVYRGTNDIPPHPDEYARVVRAALGDLSCRLIFEPGRMIAANAGILVARVVHVKPGTAKSFAIVDAAMNDLIRPTLYDAYHEIVTVAERQPDCERQVVDVVGPVCESGDYLAIERDLPALAAGDLIAVMSAGAYGAVQAGTYNSRPLIAEVMVKGDRFAVVRPRQSLDALISRDRLPDWL